SATAVADSKQTLICTYLSAAVLVGLVLNSLFGWWWADAIAGLVIAGFAVREGIEAWRGDTCATSIGMLLEDEHDDHEHDTLARKPVVQRAAHAPRHPRAARQ
ncbi:MAG TPA: cation transporter, partial [Actinomycetota bacterium]